MRVDLVLRYLCLAKSRSVAKRLCDDGRVDVGGERARGSTAVRAGDRVTIRYNARVLTVAVTEVPGKPLSKSRARDYYEVVADEALAGDDDDW